MMRNLLYEMAVQREQDVFAMEPVASVTTEVTDTLEGEELRRYVFKMIQPKIANPKFTVTEQDIGILIRHHCGHRHLKKAALLALPYVINANIVTAKWDKNVKLDDDGNPIEDGDKRKSGMISAPILIDGVKYLCNLTNKKNGRRKVTPYALVLKDSNGNLVEWEKMDSAPYSVPHSSSKPTTIGDAHSFKATTSHDTNPSFQGAKVQQNIEKNKNNNIKTENIRMNKKQIRLTESDLRQIVKESVNKILSEAYGTMPKDDIKRAANLDAASQSRFDEHGVEIEDIKNDEFSRRLQDLQRDLTKCWWMANSLESHMKHNEFLGKASERYANYVMDNISNASDGLDRIIAIAKMKIGQ